MCYDFDIIVIGAGPGGYVAAIRAAQEGKKVAVVEKEHLGGICLNWGCIPTKALLKSAEVYKYMKRADEFGFEVGDIKIDLEKIVARSRGVATQLSRGIGGLFKKNKVTVIDGYGKLQKGKKVEVEDKQGNKKIYSAENIIIATGAKALNLKGLEVDHELVWNYKDALVAKEIPNRLLVVGTGAIGVEFANFFSILGSKVTLVEGLDRIMPNEDLEVSAFMKKSFEKQGMKVLTGTMLKGFDRDPKKGVVTATLETNGKASATEFDKVILAIGVVPNIDNIGLENTSIQKAEKNTIKVNDYLETDEKGVYAIGDVTQGPWLAHKASHEGIIAVDKILGREPHAINRRLIPGCTYTVPQVASMGYTEAEAKKDGYKIRVGRFPFIGNGKAVSSGDTEGFIKTIFDDKTGELLGVHLVGSEVTELIQGYGIAMNLETTAEELMGTVFAHPTLSEMMHEAVLDAYNKVIHM